MNRVLQDKNQLTHPFDYFKAEMKDNLSVSEETRKVFDFETENFLDIWTDILKNIDDYKVEELKSITTYILWIILEQLLMAMLLFE